MRDYASLALRLALGLTFLYSVADRFGVLGPPGSPNISWGQLLEVYGIRRRPQLVFAAPLCSEFGMDRYGR
jgi:hypothetical protein